MGRKKTKKDQYEILIEAEFSGFTDSWTEFLCMECREGDQVVLSSRSRELLAQASRYMDRYGERKDLPDRIRRKTVWGIDGDFVVGERLVPHDGRAEITVSLNGIDAAAQWLKERKWDSQPGFREAWPRIYETISSLDPNWRAGIEAAREDRLVKLRATSPQQHDGEGPRGIIIRCDGSSRPGIIWFEVVFLEWDAESFSVFISTGDVFAEGADLPRLVETIPASLTWKRVLKFIRKHDVASVDRGFRGEIEVQGVEPWQRDVIMCAMFGMSESARFLASLSDRDLKALYLRLGGFLKGEAVGLLANVAHAIHSRWPRGKTLKRVAKLVNAKDPSDLQALEEEIRGYSAERAAEEMLSNYRNAPSIPAEAFLNLLHEEPPASMRTRAELLELWLRSDPKPSGGEIRGMIMHDEFPVLHWLLTGRVVEVFAAMIGHRREELRGFVVWLLGKGRAAAARYENCCQSHSFNLYAFGRPRYSACVRLGLEVEQAALDLGIDVPDAVRLPAMPNLDQGGVAILRFR